MDLRPLMNTHHTNTYVENMSVYNWLEHHLGRLILTSKGILLGAVDEAEPHSLAFVNEALSSTHIGSI